MTTAQNYSSKVKMREIIKKIAGYHLDTLRHLLRVSNLPLVNTMELKAHEYLDVSTISLEEEIFTGKNKIILKGKEKGFKNFLRLYQEFILNPENREIYYGYPFIYFKREERSYFGPLFIIPVNFEVNLKKNHFQIYPISDEIILNTQLISQLVSEEATFKMAKLYFEKENITIPLKKQEFLNILLNILKIINFNMKVEDVKLENLAYPSESPGIKFCGAIFLLKVAFFYTLIDLREIYERGIELKNSILNYILNKEIQEEKKEEFNIKYPVYPLPFDEKKVEVANEAMKNRLTVVQGPPGTGKSQTIANLVCHLSSNNKKVLVTSEKKKALEVVIHKLNALDIKYFFFPLIKKDKNTKKILLEMLEDIETGWEKITSGNYEEKLKEYINEREEVLQGIKEKKKEFNEIIELNKRFKELFEKYKGEFERFNFLPKEIVIDESKVDEYINIFTVLFEKFRDVKHIFAEEKKIEFFENLRTYNISLSQLIDKLKILRNFAQRNLNYRICDEILEMYRNFKEDLTFFNLLTNTLTNLQQKLKTYSQILNKMNLEEFKYSKDLIDRKFFSITEIENNFKLLTQVVERYFNISNKRIIGNFLTAILRVDRDIIRTIESLPMPKKERKEFLDKIIAKKNISEWKNFKEKWNRIINFIKIYIELQNLINESKISSIKKLKIEDLLNNSEILDNVKDHIEFLKILKEIEKFREVIEISYETLLMDKNMERINKEIQALERLKDDFEKYLNYFKLMNRLPFELRRWLIKNISIIENENFVDDFKKALTARVLESKLNKMKDELQMHDTNYLFSEIINLEEKFLHLNREICRSKHYMRIREGMKGELGAEIASFKKLLKRARKNLSKTEEIKKFIDYRTILKYFPVWVIDIDEIPRLFPLISGLFDYLIIDEASQVNQTSLLPLFVRAKNVIIFGDEKQLPHYSTIFLDKNVNEDNKKKNDIKNVPKGYIFDAAEYSLLDVAEVWCDRRMMLLEHYRSLYPIINFSNKRFYNNKLIILTNGKESLKDVFEVRFIRNAVEEDKINRKEAETIVNDIMEMLKDEKYKNLSFGILSLFRRQTDYIRELINKKILENHEVFKRAFESDEPLIVSTVDGFQGDERDVILYSFRYASNSSPHIFVIEQDERRINVAFTRARKKMILYTSRPIEEYPNGMVKDFLFYALNYEKEKENFYEIEIKDLHIKRLYAHLMKKGYKIYPYYQYNGFRIDLVLKKDDELVAIEVDGIEHKGDIKDDLKRHILLEKGKWKVIRLNLVDIWYNLESTDKKILNLMKA